MANAYDLYLPSEISSQIHELLHDQSFQIKTKPRKFADGRQGADHTVSKGKNRMVILEAATNETCSMRSLMCLATPKNWLFLMEVVSMLKTKGATDKTS